MMPAIPDLCVKVNPAFVQDNNKTGIEAREEETLPSPLSLA
jgi:hypothetical protein